MKNFDDWIGNFKDSIATYEYYTDFNKIYKNIDKIKVELNILNSLVGSNNIEKDFEILIKKYPEVLKCIPILIAVRSSEISIRDNEEFFNYNFNKNDIDISVYKAFMRKTGLFELFEKRIFNVVDYVTGIETGLDSNARKNRGGHLMEDLVETYIRKSNFKKDINYFKEMNASSIVNKWNIDLSNISNKGKTEKRFDFVVKTNNMIYAIETNFYAVGGSKLNETSRSYKNLFLDSRFIKGFTFIWITDGKGWYSAKNNLRETFDISKNIYNIKELEDGILSTLLI